MSINHIRMKYFSIYLFAIISLWSKSSLNAQNDWTQGILYDGLSNPNVVDSLTENMIAANAYNLCNNKVVLDITNEVFVLQQCTQWYCFQVNGANDYQINFTANACGSEPMYLQSDSVYLYGPFNSANPSLLNVNAPILTLHSNTNYIGIGSAYLSSLDEGYYFIRYNVVSKYGGATHLCTTVQMHGGSCLPEVACLSNLTSLSPNEYRLCNSMSCDENLSVCDDNPRLFWFYDPSCAQVDNLHRVWISTHVSDPANFGLSISYPSNFPVNWRANVSEVNFYPTNTFLGDCAGLGCGGSFLHCLGGSGTWNYSPSYGVLLESDYLVEIVWSTSRIPIDQCNMAALVQFTGASCASQIVMNDWGFSVDSSGNVSMGDEAFCQNCLPRLNPEPNKRYVLEAWASQAKIPFGAQTLTHPKMQVHVHHSASSVIDVFTSIPSIVHPIIDDWQLLTLDFITPADIDFIDVSLSSDNGSTVYFDDVRFFPFDGSMKTYVYDPVTLRFVAELDERHFATIYEYDEEGQLMRVKKETERGVMTIQEVHNSTIKKP